jgi:hypothetical protein
VTDQLDLARRLRISAPEVVLVLIRFRKSVRVRLWGRALHSWRKGEVDRVSMAIAAVLFAQGCAEPVVQPPAVPLARVA